MADTKQTTNKNEVGPIDSSSPPSSETMTNGADTQSTKSMASFRLLLLVLMVLQNSSTVLVGRHTRTVDKDQLYVVNHLILITEGMKCVLSCVLEYFATNGRLWESIKENILDRPLDALKISVPALLYLVQNSLLYVALSNLSAPLFQVTYQCKLVTTALVSVLMLQRKYAFKQWVCLFGLSIGVAIVVLGENAKKEEDEAGKAAQSLAVGLVAVSVACVSSALAGVYFEKVLKKPTTENAAPRAPVSLWMRNVQLAFFSMLIAVFQGMLQVDEGEAKPYLHGFTFWVWVLVGLQAGGGLLVAAVIKYADNVLKGLATGVSVVVATLCSMILFKTPLSGQFTTGALMILVSVYLFSNDIPAFLTGGKTKSAEMTPVLPK